MGILKNLFGVSKEKPEYERKPEISAENPDFATRSVLADLQKQLGKEPRDCNSEDFAGNQRDMGSWYLGGRTSETVFGRTKIISEFREDSFYRCLFSSQRYVSFTAKQEQKGSYTDF